MANTIKNIRLTNFLKLLKEYKFDKELGEKLGWSPAYISQIKNGTKAIGGSNARKVEAIFKLNEGYMDVRHDKSNKSTQYDDEDTATLAAAIQQLPSHLRDHIKRLTYAIASEIPSQKPRNHFNEDSD